MTTYKVDSIIRFFIFWVGITYVSSYFFSLLHLFTSVSCVFTQLVLFMLFMKQRKRIFFSFKFRYIRYICVTIAVLTFIQGFFSAPNNTDVLTYHLPQVMYWVQARSIIQTTQNTAHDYVGNLPGVLVANLYQITSNDRFSFVPQWIGFIMIMLTTYLFSKELGMTTRSRDCCILIVGLLPMSILQSTTQQADLLTATFLFTSAYYLYVWTTSKRIQELSYCILSLSFSILSKETAAIFALPLVYVILRTFIVQRSKLKTNSIVLVLSSCIILPFYIQTYLLYHGFTPKNPGHYSFFNESFSVSIFISNVIRNFMLHVPIPIPKINVWTYEFIGYIHRFIQISMNDPRSTWPGTVFTVSPILFPHEDLASAPLQVFLICAGLVTFFLHRRSSNAFINRLFIGLLGSFLVFCLLLKWQPWHVRLHLPFIVVASFCSIYILRNRGRLLSLVAILSVIVAFSVTLLDATKPYVSYAVFEQKTRYFSSHSQWLPRPFWSVPRNDQYYTIHEDREASYRMSINELTQSGATKVSFHITDGFTYPLWVELKRLNSHIIVLPEFATSKNSIISSNTGVVRFLETK